MPAESISKATSRHKAVSSRLSAPERLLRDVDGSPRTPSKATSSKKGDRPRSSHPPKKIRLNDTIPQISRSRNHVQRQSPKSVTKQIGKGHVYRGSTGKRHSHPTHKRLSHRAEERTDDRSSDGGANEKPELRPRSRNGGKRSDESLLKPLSNARTELEATLARELFSTLDASKANTTEQEDTSSELLQRQLASLDTQIRSLSRPLGDQTISTITNKGTAKQSKTSSKISERFHELSQVLKTSARRSKLLLAELEDVTHEIAGFRDELSGSGSVNDNDNDNDTVPSNRGSKKHGYAAQMRQLDQAHATRRGELLRGLKRELNELHREAKSTEKIETEYRNKKESDLIAFLQQQVDADRVTGAAAGASGKSDEVEVEVFDGISEA